MKVCLVSPATVSEFGELARLDDIRSIAEQTPLGILSLAAILEAAGNTPHVIALNRSYYEYLDSQDRSSYADFCEFAVQQLVSIQADFFGLGSICSSYPLSIRIARELKRQRPGATIVLGGPQASVVDVETLRAFPWIDLVVRGEAEETLPQVLEVVLGKAHPEQVPGITFRAGGKISRNPDAPVILDLDALPLPAFHHYLDPAASGYAVLELGRGCPFSCTFCSTNDFFRRRFRLKSPQRMIEQMTAVQQTYGVRRFELVHDMFTVDRKRVVEFCEALIAAGKGFLWSCSARSDCVDPALIELMARAGCRGIFFGIETGSPRLQKLIDKGLDLEQAAVAVEDAHTHGIGLTVSLITGFPEETIDDLRDTVSFMMNAARLERVNTQLQLLAALAKTPIQTQYKNDLRLSDLSPGISTVGWEQSRLDLEMIRAWPDVFPNFYSLPTRLDRGYLGELRVFLRCGLHQFRWLLLTLHVRAGGILGVFEEWKQWCEDRHGPAESSSLLQYYLREEFVQEFFAFVRNHFLENRAIEVLLDYEIQWRQAGKKAEQNFRRRRSKVKVQARITLDSIPQLAAGACLVPIAPEAGTIIRAIKAGQKGVSTQPSPGQEYLCVHTSDGQRLEKEKLTPLAAGLITLCDGRSSLRSICAKFARRKQTLAGLEKLDLRRLCVAGLIELAERGLLTFRPARKKRLARRSRPSRRAEISLPRT